MHASTTKPRLRALQFSAASASSAFEKPTADGPGAAGTDMAPLLQGDSIGSSSTTTSGSSNAVLGAVGAAAGVMFVAALVALAFLFRGRRELRQARDRLTAALQLQQEADRLKQEAAAADARAAGAESRANGLGAELAAAKAKGAQREQEVEQLRLQREEARERVYQIERERAAAEARADALVAELEQARAQAVEDARAAALTGAYGVLGYWRGDEHMRRRCQMTGKPYDEQRARAVFRAVQRIAREQPDLSSHKFERHYSKHLKDQRAGWAPSHAEHSDVWRLYRAVAQQKGEDHDLVASILAEAEAGLVTGA